MGASQRRKGQAAERELFALLSDELGFVVRRNVDQARLGGADSLELPGFAPEIKRHEVLRRPSWWRQAVRQAAKVMREPVVFYRRSRDPWRVLVMSGAGYRDVEWSVGVEHIREKLARLHAIYPEAA